MCPSRLIASVLVCSAFAPVLSAADWTMFRGPDRNGVSSETTAPLTWAPDENVKWRAALPRPGNSSPVVAGDRVFVTCAENDKGTRRSLYCFARADGKQLWVQTVPYERQDPTHNTNPYCAASPAVDVAGKRVLAWHGSAGLHCYDFDGKPLWSRDLGVIRHIWGWAGSPVIHNDVVYLNAGPGVRQFVAAISLNTGDVLWQTDEPGGAEDKHPQTKNWLGSWGTPVVTKVDGEEQVLCFMSGKVNAYDPKTGKILWHCGGAGVLAYTDVIVSPEQDGGGKIGVAMAGYGGAAIGFKLGGSGDVTASNRLWQLKEKNPQRVGSGVIVGQHVYVPSEPEISCFELKTGKKVWNQRVPGGCWGSIVKVGDRLYVTSKPGVTYVFAADPTEYKELARNDLGEPSNSTPAVSDGQIFLRTAKGVYCVEER